MTQATIPNRCAAFQAELMDALEAVWASIKHSSNPAALREARDRARAIGDLAVLARKVALVLPLARPKAAVAPALAHLDALLTPDPAPGPVAAPMAAQAEHARRALEKLKGGGRARL